MESKTNYTIVGALVLLLTAGLVGAAIWLSVGFDQKRYRIYAVYMSEAVSGLSEDAPVKFNGVKVGYVNSIRLNQDNPQQVQILLNVDADTPVTQSTSATLISQGITGSTYVGLSASTSSLKPLTKAPGEPYPIIPSKASLFNQLDNALKGVSENINSVTIEVKRVFNEENTENLKETLRYLKDFTKALSEVAPDTKNLVTNVSKASKTFPSVTTHFNHSLVELTQQTIPALNKLLLKMNRIATDLEGTSRQLRQNPSVVIRGRSPAKPGPGE